VSSFYRICNSARPKRPLSEFLASLVGLALIVLSGVVLTGWLTETWALVRVLPSASPMRFNTAVCIGLSGLSYLLLANRWTKAAHWLSVGVATFALLTVSQDLSGLDFGLDNLQWRDASGVGPNKPGRMAPNTALCFLLLGYGLSLLTRTRPLESEAVLHHASSWQFLVACLAGTLVLAIGGISTIGYASGLEATYGWGGSAGMAVHTAAAFVISGGTLSVLSSSGATRWPSAKRPQLPAWLPIPAATLVVALTLALSQSLYFEEVKSSRREQQTLVKHLVLRLRGELDNRRKSLERMASRLQPGRSPTFEQWETDAREYMRHFPDLTQFTRVDAAGRMWQASQPGLNTENLQVIAQRQASEVVHFEQNGRQNYIICPITHEGESDGYLEIAWNTEEFLRGQTRYYDSLGYQTDVNQGNRSIFQSSPAATPATVGSVRSAAAILETSGLNWTVSLRRPSSANLIRELQLPAAVFVGGVLFAISFALAVHAALRARNRSQLAETMAAELQRSHTRFRAIFDQTFQFIGLMSTDGKVLEANRTALAFAGIDEAAVIGQFFWDTPWWAHSPELQVRLRDAVSRAAAGEMTRFEATHQAADGRISTVDFSLKPVRNEVGEVCLLIPEGRDITSLKQTEEKLRTSEQRMELAIRGSSDGIWDWTIETGEVYYSPRYKQLLGYDDAEFTDRLESFSAIVHPEDVSRVWAACQANFETAASYDITMRLRTKSGEYRWFRSRGDAVRDPDGRAVRMAGSISDVTEQVLAEHELTRKARLDKLTGLPNRSLLLDRLQNTIQRAQTSGEAHYAVMFLDFDRFKFVNDCLGHDVGDALLQGIAERLQNNVRSVDSVSRMAVGNTAARIGGDEFVILLEGLATPMDVVGVADRLLSELAAPYQLGEHEVYSTASIGIALGDLGYHSADDVLRDADLAMYEAKRAGKARHALFDASLRSQLVRRQRLEQDLRKAIELEQLVLRYQPVTSLANGQICEVEVLLAWHHPQEGCIDNSEVMSLAEESGLVHQLGSWLLHSACSQMILWQRELGNASPPLISLNISPKEFARREWLDQVRRVLTETGLAPERLQFEIDERALGRDATATIATMHELRNLGVQLAMDGFGNGGGSLAAVHRLPVRAIKAHPSLIAEIEHCKYAASLVHALAVLLRNLDMRVIMTGIERSSQVLALQELGCGYGQGTLLGQPVTADELADCFGPTNNETTGAMFFAHRLADHMHLDPIGSLATK
jgi:diguanylate cyclase (GGDEF)-like protein/PAS domain S-box-containing protein